MSVTGLWPARACNALAPRDALYYEMATTCERPRRTGNGSDRREFDGSAYLTAAGRAAVKSSPERHSSWSPRKRRISGNPSPRTH
jgi:hypothetical protein